MSSPSEKRGKHIKALEEAEKLDKALEEAEKLAQQAALDKAARQSQRQLPAKSKNAPKKKFN